VAQLDLRSLKLILPRFNSVNNKLENSNPNAEAEDLEKTNEEAKKSSADEVKTKE
jgi:hypothetical protein